MADNISRPVSLSAWLSEPVPTSSWQARAQQLWLSWRALRSNPSVMFGGTVILAVAVIAIFAPLFATHDIYAQDLSIRLQKPSIAHWLGTDELGRDVYSRLMRIVDVFLAFPSLILALAFVAALGPGIDNAIIAISLAAWPPIARLARAETLSIRKSDYIAAVQLQKASSFRIIFGHVMPMCISSVVVRVTLNMASIILTAAGLGFLGLGAQPPSPEWGAMLSSAREFVLTNGTIAAIPGMAILVVSLAFNLLGDGLRDMLDPRHG